MSDAAQGEPIQHEVFNTPFKVVPQYEMWETPANYRHYPGGDKLPAQLRVWRIQDTGKGSRATGGVVANPECFDGFPDSEALAPGYNSGKQSGAVGVGRHGNFLLWGFSGPPSLMTQAGQDFFLNCICYMRRFDGKPPLALAMTRARTDAMRMAVLMKVISDPSWGQSAFPDDLLGQYKGNPDGLAKYFEDNLELVYRQQREASQSQSRPVRHYFVDDELGSLGLESNRKLETLEKLISFLTDPQKAPLASKLLRRYSNESFQTPQQWQTWLNSNKGRIFFTDVGGYKFLVVPAGYLQTGR